MYETLTTHGHFDSRNTKVREAIDWADSVLPAADPDSTFLDRLLDRKLARDDFQDCWNAIPTTMCMPPYRSVDYLDFTGSSPVPTHYIISHPDMECFNSDKWGKRPTNITDDSEGLVLRATNCQFRLYNMWFSEAILFTYAVHTKFSQLLTQEKLGGTHKDGAYVLS